MPLITKETIDPPAQLRVKVKQSTLKRLEAYVNYVGSSKDYCVEQALLFVMDKDREFHRPVYQAGLLLDAAKAKTKAGQ